MSDLTANRTGTDYPEPEFPLPTLDEYLEAYSQQPVEVVNGVVIPVHPPALDHSLIAHTLYDSLSAFLLREKTGGRVLTETAYLLDADDRSDWVRGSRIPDVSYMTADHFREQMTRRKSGDPIRGVPDIAVEIVSPHDKYEDVQTKILDYVRSGVSLTIVISPKFRTVRMITADNSEGQTLTEADTLTASPVIEGWSIPITQIFEGVGS